MPPRIDIAALAAVPVLDEEGAPVRLGDAWKDGPAVLVFVRHFGCLFCREDATRLRGIQGDLASAGASIVVVGSGAPPFAKGFREATGLEARVLCDRDLRSYTVAGMHRSVWGTLGPRAAVNAVRTLARGFLPRPQQGDQWQQGGALLVTQAGQVAFHHAAETAGEPLPLEGLLAAARAHAAPPPASAAPPLAATSAGA